MSTYSIRTMSGLGVRLSALTSLRGRSRRAGQGPRARAAVAATRATEPTTVDLLDGASHPDGDIVRLRAVGAAVSGEIVRDGSRITYRSRRLFIGREAITFELTDSFGMIGRSTVTIDVAPHPAVGLPFTDGSFFADETGFSLEGA